MSERGNMPPDYVPSLLRGWKDIGEVLGCDRRTARALDEADAALCAGTEDAPDRIPIYKPSGAANGAVVAERGDLLRWLYRVMMRSRAARGAVAR